MVEPTKKNHREIFLPHDSMHLSNKRSLMKLLM